MSRTSPEQSPAPLPLRRPNPPIHPTGSPSRSTLLTLAFIGLGYVVGLGAPSLVVSPTQPSAPLTEVLLALGLTMVGVAISLAAGGLAFWRDRNYGWLIITWMPAIALVSGGAILAATKIS